MYSRNTSKKNARGRLANERVASVPLQDNIENDVEADVKDRGGEQEYKASALPLPPPNYRGMIYDRESTFFEYTDAEGIERLVKNDASYCTEKMRKLPKKLDRKAFSHLDPPVCDNCGSSNENGLEKLVKGLREKNFQPEDILICAMIMLMLNSKSEDDILMVLVLMLLL